MPDHSPTWKFLIPSLPTADPYLLFFTVKAAGFPAPSPVLASTHLFHPKPLAISSSSSTLPATA